MPPAKPQSRVIEFLVIFIGAFLLSQAVATYFGAKTTKADADPILMHVLDATVREGHHPELRFTNATELPWVLPSRCPEAPLDIFRVEPSASGSGETLIELHAAQTTVACADDLLVPAGGSVQLSLAPWKYALFTLNGTYEVRVPESVQREDTPKPIRFSLYEAGTVVKLFRTFVTKPLLNLLIFIASLLPGYNLGLAIIILTLVVKLLLFFPTQHAMEGQRKMQLLQPKLQDIKKQWAGDLQKQNEETMKLWREHRINPFSSCLPILLQFPVLIGLFYVIRDGSVLELSRHLIYPFYAHLDWQFGHAFLWWNLTKPDMLFFPAFLVILQFFQMKLSFHFAKKKGKKQEKKEEASPMEMQQKMMLYVLPFMIGFFALKFPVAVSLYWGVSTLFAIGQQLIVNREHLQV
jgi:YidC/Oxa1 family membrane protein insertase